MERNRRGRIANDAARAEMDRRVEEMIEQVRAAEVAAREQREAAAAEVAVAAPEAPVDPAAVEARRARARAARERAMAHQRRAADRADRAHVNRPAGAPAAAAAPGGPVIRAPVARRVHDPFLMEMDDNREQRPHIPGFLDLLRNEFRNDPIRPRRPEIGREMPLGRLEMPLFARPVPHRPPENREQNLARRALETVTRHRARAERHLQQRTDSRRRAQEELADPEAQNMTQERRDLLNRRIRQANNTIDEIRRQVVDFRAQEVAAQAEANRLGVVPRNNDHPEVHRENRAQWNRNLARAAVNGDDEARMQFIEQNEMFVQEMLRNNPPNARPPRPLNGPTGVIWLGEGSDDEEIPVVDLEQQEAMTAGNGTLNFKVNFKVAVPCNVPMPPYCDHRGAGQVYAPMFGIDYMGWSTYQVRDWARMFWRRDEHFEKIINLRIDGQQLHKIADKTLSYATEFPAMNWHTFQVNAAALRNYFFGYESNANDGEEMGRRRDVDMIRRLMGDNIGEEGIMRFLQQWGD